MRRYLIGDIRDTIKGGLYPIVLINEIEKKDLIRSKENDLIIIDLDNNTFYNYDKNVWEKIKEFFKFSDQYVDK